MAQLKIEKRMRNYAKDCLEKILIELEGEYDGLFLQMELMKEGEVNMKKELEVAKKLAI